MRAAEIYEFIQTDYYTYDYLDSDKEILLPLYNIQSASELNSVFQKARSNGELRALATDNDIIVWDAYYEVHSPIIEYLTDEPGSSYAEDDFIALLYLYKNGVAYAKRSSEDVSNHPILKKIYGDPIPFREAESESI